MGGKGSGGHNRKPTALKKVQGNPGRRPLNDREPTPPPGMPRMPRGLCRDAQIEWRFIVPVLSKMGVLTQADGAALAAYCDARAQWLAANKAIKKYGLVIAQVDERSNVATLKANPAVRIKNEAMKTMKSFLTEFGLTPASRSKLTVIEGRDIQANDHAQDPLEDFLGRKPASEVAQ